MHKSLVIFRKTKGLTQEELGRAIAARLHRPIGKSYAQKKIANFEAGTAAPTEDELQAMADELGVEPESLRNVISPRAPNEAGSVIDQIADRSRRGRSLMASCMFSRPRPQILDESYGAIKAAIEANLSMAVFVPFPTAVNIPEPSDHINSLLGHYSRVRRSVLDANLAFKNSLDRKRSKALALYFPRAELLKSSAILIPPICRQFSLTIEEEKPNGPITKTLHLWTPGTDADTVRPLKATGLYSLDEQIEAWQAFFGDIIPHWIATNEFLQSDPYWEKIR